MTRRTAKLAAVYLLLGLAATWAVVCAATLSDGFHAEYESAERQVRREDGGTEPWIRAVERCEGWGSIHLETWLDPVWAGPNYERTTRCTPEAVAGMLRIPLIGEGTLPDSLLYMGQESKQVIARGWPCPALWHEYTYARERDPASADPAAWRSYPVASAHLTPGGARLGSSELEFGVRARTVPRAIPLRPVWPGLIADTLFYALLFAGLHRLSAWGRRTRRRRRGRCAACGYDLFGLNSPTCPECGHNP